MLLVIHLLPDAHLSCILMRHNRLSDVLTHITDQMTLYHLLMFHLIIESFHSYSLALLFTHIFSGLKYSFVP